MKIAVELPDTPAVTELDPAYLKDALVATLYYVGKLSEKEACLILGLSRRTFEALLPRFGFAILADASSYIPLLSTMSSKASQAAPDG